MASYRSSRALIRAAAVLALVLCNCRPATAAEKPNVIIISLDLLRTDRLAAYGGDKNLTPNIDAFARRSVVYLNAISPASWTLPAAMSVLTGLYPWQHKISNPNRKNGLGQWEDNSLDPGVKLLTEVFRSQGYATAGFTGGMAYSYKYGFDRGFDVYSDETAVKIKESFRSAQGRLAGAPGPEPFFFLIQGFDLLLAHFRDQDPFDAAVGSDPSNYDAGRTAGTVGYDKRVAAADLAFGDFMAFLEKKGIFKNTVIVFLSTHGEGLGTHGPLTHGSALYEELIHVPLMIYRPGTAPAVMGTQVSLLDVGPTLIAAAGLKENKKFTAQARGKALYPFAVKKNDCADAFSETDFQFIFQKSAVRTCAGWKLIYDSKTSASELYDLAADPAEKNNLYEKEPEMAGRLEKELFDWQIR